MKAVGRAGMAARGALHLLVGVLAVELVRGRGAYQLLDARYRDTAE